MPTRSSRATGSTACRRGLTAFAHLPSALRRAFVGPLVNALPRLHGLAPGTHPGLILAAHRYLSKMLAGVDLPPEERYVFYRSHYTDAELLRLYAPQMRATLSDAAAGSEHLDYFGEVQGQDFLNRMLYVDWKTFLPELNLAYSRQDEHGRVG